MPLFLSMYSLKAKTWLERDGRFVMSEGRARLLRAIDEQGSIRKAAESMQMSYRHAWGIIRKINTACEGKVVTSTRGGGEGGKSALTELGREILREYEVRSKDVDNLIRFGRKPLLAVDGIIIYKGKLVLVKRRNEPFKGWYALPGGFVEYGERTEDAVVREVREETGLRGRIKSLVGVYSRPERDPRGHVVSIVYELELINGKLRAGDDAKEIGLFGIEEIPELSFDHNEIVSDYKRGRAVMR